MQIKTNNKSGFTLVEIMIVVAIIGLLAAIAIPNFIKARTTAQKNACIENLHQIDGAKEQWGVEGKISAGTAAVTSSINGYLKNSNAPLCPGGGTYTYNALGTDPVCTLSTVGHTL